MLACRCPVLYLGPNHPDAAAARRSAVSKLTKPSRRPSSTRTHAYINCDKSTDKTLKGTEMLIADVLKAGLEHV
jgi:hypothetical protein